MCSYRDWPNVLMIRHRYLLVVTDWLITWPISLQGDSEHPICPVMLQDAKLASTFADMMLDEGIYVIGFSFPVVPKGEWPGRRSSGSDNPISGTISLFYSGRRRYIQQFARSDEWAPWQKFERNISFETDHPLFYHPSEGSCFQF